MRCLPGPAVLASGWPCTISPSASRPCRSKRSQQKWQARRSVSVSNQVRLSKQSVQHRPHFATAGDQTDHILLGEDNIFKGNVDDTSCIGTRPPRTRGVPGRLRKEQPHRLICRHVCMLCEPAAGKMSDRLACIDVVLCQRPRLSEPELLLQHGVQTCHPQVLTSHTASAPCSCNEHSCASLRMQAAAGHTGRQQARTDIVTLQSQSCSC